MTTNFFNLVAKLPESENNFNRITTSGTYNAILNSYKLDCSYKSGKPGKYMILTFKTPESQEFNIFLVSDSTDEKELNKSVHTYRKILKAANLDYTAGEINLDELKNIPLVFSLTCVEKNGNFNTYINSVTNAEDLLGF